MKRKCHLTVSDIRSAVMQLREANTPPNANGCYTAEVHPMSIIDMLLTYKRPKASKLYKQLRRSYEAKQEKSA